MSIVSKAPDAERIVLSELTSDDAPFILELLNEPDWLRFIGDRGVHDLDCARAYIEKVQTEMYDRLGFGLYKVSLKDGNIPLGLCGLLKRDTLPDTDIGFAFLLRHRGYGYAYEAAGAILDLGLHVLGLKRILAITDPANVRSIRLLHKLDFRFLGRLHLEDHSSDSNLYEYWPVSLSR